MFKLKKIIEGMCPLSKLIIKISLAAPFILVLIFSAIMLIDKEKIIHFPDYLTAAVLLPAVAITVSLFGDLIWRDKTKR
jgi:FtsH-binding integral membrane protein